jgi:gluconolactonase
MKNNALLVCTLITGSLFVACKSTSPSQVETPPPAPRTEGLLCVPPANDTNAPITVRNVVGKLGDIERLDPALDELLDKDVSMQKLADGFNWSEGPVWMGDHLLFSDVPMNTVFRWDERSGIAIAFQPSGYTGKTPRAGEPGSNGLTRDSEGRLILCQHGDRRVVRREKDGRFSTIADQYRSRRLNSPNDAVVKSNGDIYFTDPPYGLVNNMNDKTKELPFQGVYRWSATDKRVTLLNSDMSRPNGLAFSPDEKVLYVANSDPTKAIWMAFPVNSDGTLGTGKVFLIFSPAGKHLGTLATGEATANCGWGDDGSTLYITADMYLCRVKTKVKGAGKQQ